MPDFKTREIIASYYYNRDYVFTKRLLMNYNVTPSSDNDEIILYAREKMGLSPYWQVSIIYVNPNLDGRN